MECLKDHVHKKFHHLLLNKLPSFQKLLGKKSFADSKNQFNNTSDKILNGPQMSRDTNESETSYEVNHLINKFPMILRKTHFCS